MLSLVIGGARSGKSRFAQSLAAASQRVIFVATARCEDAEMAARIARHREQRPSHWITVEEPLEIGCAIERCAAAADLIVLDCLTLWLSNLCWARRDDNEESLYGAAAREVARIGCSGAAHVVVVSNEVGCGLVPESRLGRLFRDLQGHVNQEAARAADWVYHLVAGIAVPIKQPRV